MKDKKRALRRKYKGLRKKYAKKIACSVFGFQESDSFCKNLVQNSDNITICSCDMCRNPRTNGWNKTKQAKTIQEIIFDQKTKDQL